MPSARELAQRVLPPTPLARQLSMQSVLFATGRGTFETGSAVFFTQIVGLTAGQVGLGLTVAGLVAFALAVPIGRLVDRVGTRRMWTAGSGLSAALFCVWPLIHGLPAYLLMMVALELAGNAAGAAWGAYTIDVFPREERVRSQAFMRSALNLGFTLGALFAGIALAFDDNGVVRMVPLVTAAAMVVNAIWIQRLPAAPHEQRDAGTTLPPPADTRRTALRNRGFVTAFACDGVLSTNQVLLTVLIPLWLVQETDAPRVLLAWLFGTNTVLAVLLQVRAARGVDTVPSALRAVRRSCAFFVASCLIVAFTHDTVGWVTIALVWVGHVTVTGAELFASAGHWGLISELSDPDRRGEYQGAAQLGSTMGQVWAPAVYTALAISWGTLGWFTIAGFVVVATVVIHPAARAAERFLAQGRPADAELRPA